MAVRETVHRPGCCPAGQIRTRMEKRTSVIRERGGDVDAATRILPLAIEIERDY